MPSRPTSNRVRARTSISPTTIGAASSEGSAATAIPTSSSCLAPMFPADLPAEWRAKAEEFRRFGADDQALTLEACADDLGEAYRAWQDEPLTLEEAAEESGYGYSSLQQRVSSGEIPNAGEKGQPRIRRADLPRKARARCFELELGEPDLAAEVLAGKL